MSNMRCGVLLQVWRKASQRGSNLLGWTLVHLYKLEMFWHSLWLLLEIAIRSAAQGNINFCDTQNVLTCTE